MRRPRGTRAYQVYRHRWPPSCVLLPVDMLAAIDDARDEPWQAWIRSVVKAKLTISRNQRPATASAERGGSDPSPHHPERPLHLEHRRR